MAGWRTTGPFDFDVWSHNVDWDGVTHDLSNIVLGSLLFMEGAGLAGAGAEGAGLDAVLGRGAKGFIDRHHPNPRFMGGRDDQETVELVQDFHRKFHGRLRAELKGQDVPPIGGRSGSADHWKDFFKDDAARDWAVKNLRRVTRDFDVEHGTSIEPYLDKALRMPRPEAPPPKN